jgi:branched-chain amino acid transport system ATP-binding protein
MSSVLILDDVTAGYVGDIDVLRSLSLTVEAGSITGLIGLNGAGKSTVMKAICGFLKPKTGRVVYQGNDITGLAPHHLSAQGIWYIPQESSLFPFMTVVENLRLPLESLGRATGSLDRKEIDGSRNLRACSPSLKRKPAICPADNRKWLSSPKLG